MLSEVWRLAGLKSDTVFSLENIVSVSCATLMMMLWLLPRSVRVRGDDLSRYVCAGKDLGKKKKEEEEKLAHHIV